MIPVKEFIIFELYALYFALAGVICYRMLTGRINMRGLLRDQASGRISPARIQALMLTLGGALHLLSQVLAQPPGARAFPEIPNELLLLLGGSHALYLGAKTNSLGSLR